MGWAFFDNAGRLKSVGAAGAAGSNKLTYIYMSKPNPTTGLGRKFFADRNFTVTNVYAWCTDTAPSGTLQVDVRKNGTSIYPSASKPTVTAGNFLGADTTPDTTGVSKGDKLEVYLTTLAGATGRVGVAISGTYL